MAETLRQERRGEDNGQRRNMNPREREKIDYMRNHRVKEVVKSQTREGGGKKGQKRE